MTHKTDSCSMSVRICVPSRSTTIGYKFDLLLRAKNGGAGRPIGNASSSEKHVYAIQSTCMVAELVCKDRCKSCGGSSVTASGPSSGPLA